MKCWGTVIACLIACGAAPGCNRPDLVPEYDADHYRTDPLAKGVEEDALAPVAPKSTRVPKPATVLELEREPYHLSLREAVALALEHGTVGVQSNRLLGVANDDLVQFTGQGLTGTDSIRVLAIDPALSGATIEGALSRFDPQWITSLTWTTTDEPPQGPNSPGNGEMAALSTSLVKPLPTGGVAGITVTTDYSFLSPGSVALAPGLTPFNPFYVPKLQFGFEQPLLRDYGVDANQLTANSPFSTLFPGLNAKRPGLPPEGILISRLRFDQSRAEFERNVNFLLLNVEVAYWNLYGAYVSLYGVEEGLRQAHSTWLISKHRFDEGDVDRGDFGLARAQYEQFRGDRLQALETVLDNERTLRLLIGLPVSDGKQLVPIDTPTLARSQPNWEAAVEEALSCRPELVLARQELKAKQLNLLNQKNYLEPDLRFVANYSLLGLGSRLDGTGSIVDPTTGVPLSENALRSLASGRYTDWSTGLTLTVPLGFRLEHALVRQARLQVLQARLLLQDQESKAQTFLARQYGHLLEAYEVIGARRAQREALAQQVAARSSKFREGNLTIDFLLDAQRQWANALAAEAQAVVDYNNALARFEFAKGTILQHDNVVIGEGPLPQCAQVRAVEHERERTKALILRERPTPEQPAAAGTDGALAAPGQSPQTAPTLLSLFGMGTPGQGSSGESAQTRAPGLADRVAVALRPVPLPPEATWSSAPATPAAGTRQPAPPAEQTWSSSPGKN